MRRIRRTNVKNKKRFGLAYVFLNLCVNSDSCDLSTSNHEDSKRIESRFDGYRVYGTTLIFLWETCADSYGSAIRGFCNREIVLNFAIF